MVRDDNEASHIDIPGINPRLVVLWSSTLPLGHEELLGAPLLDNWYNNNKAIRNGKYLARHMPVLGNVHPIKIENFEKKSWRHFSARSSCYIINWHGYPRGSHDKYLKEIVSPVFEIRHWMGDFGILHVMSLAPGSLVFYLARGECRT